MKRNKSIVVTSNHSAIKLTKDQAIELGIDITLDQQQGISKTVGVWQILVSYKALVVANEYREVEVINTWGNYNQVTKVAEHIYGIRTMYNIRQSGYCAEGYVSVNGKKYSAFTSSTLFDVEGKLISVATINVRIPEYIAALKK